MIQNMLERSGRKRRILSSVAGPVGAWSKSRFQSVEGLGLVRIRDGNRTKKLVGPIEIPSGRFAWMRSLEGATFGVFSPAKGVHEGVFKVQNGVFL
jgi:hypothetical protein